MRDRINPKLSKWPFFLGDALLLGAAYFVYFQSKLPMGTWQIFFVVVCVAGGACLGILPFLLEYRLGMKLAETDAVGDSISQIQNLDKIATQIGDATGQLGQVQVQADKTAGIAKELAERMAAEVKAFNDFMQKANDNEKATLRLEVEKLRRAEGEWLQVAVRILDHVYALHAGALRSGQPRVVDQLTHFQGACRDAARRVGLTPFVAERSEPFDPQKHQLVEVDAKPSTTAIVSETIATGYTFQGRLIRPALVKLLDEPPGKVLSEPPAKENNQSQLPLEQASV